MVYYDQVVSAGAYYRPPAFGQNGAPAWTDDLIFVAPYNPSPTLSGAATLDDFTTTGGSSTTIVTALSGAATLDDFTTAGGTSVGVVSILSGVVTLDDFATTGGTSSALSGGTITLVTVRNWGNVLRDNTLIENVCVLDLTGRTVVYEQTNRTTDAFGNLAITDNSIAPGIEYMVATWNTAGTVRGFAKVTAT